jgi:hypothetical protein
MAGARCADFGSVTLPEITAAALSAWTSRVKLWRCNVKFLNDRDLDLGSAGPVLIPDTPPRIIGGGKEGVLYVLSPTNRGKYAARPTAPNCQNGNAVQQVNAFLRWFTMDRRIGAISSDHRYSGRGPDSAWVYA